MRLLRVLTPCLTVLSVLSTPVMTFAKASHDAVNATDGPDIVKFIQCKATAQEYNAFAFEFADNEKKAKQWGWKKAKAGKGMLSVYTLAKPINVYGERTARIAFSGSGIVAFLAAGRAPALVQELGLAPIHQGSQAKVYGKTISFSKEKVGDQLITSLTQVSVSTSAAYQNATLVGCSYSVNFE
ncbi:MAG: hypothetical protein SF187_23445 [Deltaproteobacteria bacterium]|nr:hypothetical protein [Deltaproteobacteria bacterium]